MKRFWATISIGQPLQSQTDQHLKHNFVKKSSKTLSFCLPSNFANVKYLFECQYRKYLVSHGIARTKYNTSKIISCLQKVSTLNFQPTIRESMTRNTLRFPIPPPRRVWGCRCSFSDLALCPLQTHYYFGKTSTSLQV